MTGGTMNKQTKINENAQETKNREEFIMLPTVAFCFKECKDKAGNGCESCFEKRTADGF